MMESRFFLAKRYAQAFLNLFALQYGHIEKINAAISYFADHAELFSLLKVPLLDPRLKINALEDCLISRFGLPSEFKQLIELLVKQKRSYLIADVLKQVIQMYQSRQGIELFTISSCPELGQLQEKRITDFLNDKTHHTIMCHMKLDKDLIAGIRMQSNEHLWEYSVKQQLARIQALINDHKD